MLILQYLWIRVDRCICGSQFVRWMTTKVSIGSLMFLMKKNKTSRDIHMNLEKIALQESDDFGIWNAVDGSNEEWMSTKERRLDNHSYWRRRWRRRNAISGSPCHTKSSQGRVRRKKNVLVGSTFAESTFGTSKPIAFFKLVKTETSKVRKLPLILYAIFIDRLNWKLNPRS